MNSDLPPASPQGHFAAVNDIQMYYELYGEGDPLLLLHGFTGSTLFWQPYIADFAEHFRLIVPDMRGHGRSSNPTNQFTFRQQASDVFALLEQLEISHCSAIGFSGGSATLLHMSTQQPTRFESLVLTGVAHHWPEHTRAEMRKVSFDSADPGWIEILRQRHVYGDDQIRKLLQHFYDFSDSYDDMNFTATDLATITAKTLIINGDRDKFNPVSIPNELYSALSNAYLWIVPNGEHFPFKAEQAKLFTETTLNFL